MSWPPWRKPAAPPPPADEIAQRLESVADELEDATTELRSLVSGLRADERLPPAATDEGVSE